MHNQNHILVADVMTREPITITVDATLLECAKRMVKKKTGSLLIMEGKKLVGFIANDDILWALVRTSQKELSQIRAIDIATKKIATIKPEASLQDALAKMKKYRFRRLPVIKDKELVGIVTMRDILSFNPEIYPEINELELLREEEEKLKRIKRSRNIAYMQQGICEECGDVGSLFRVDGRLICESCKEAM